jgi:hypothetical protein
MWTKVKFFSMQVLGYNNAATVRLLAANLLKTCMIDYLAGD